VNAAAKRDVALGFVGDQRRLVTVAYTDPTVGDDPNAIQDVNGNDAATLTASA